MSAIEEIGLTKNEIKNRQNKEKLLNAMEQIMEKYDYNTVTIRNICKVSGVSYGSFYNIFETKEKFLCYYLTSDFSKFMEEYYEKNKEFETLSLVEKSIDGFICCAKYNEKKGLHFVSGFYAPNNHSLFPDADVMEDSEHSFSPLVVMAKKYLKEAADQGQIKKDVSIDQTAHTFCYIFNGITFNWCLSQGKFDIVQETKRILKEYIKTL